MWTVHTGTMLGPYFGKTVQKEDTEEETHEWLWEVNHTIQPLHLCVHAPCVFHTLHY